MENIYLSLKQSNERCCDTNDNSLDASFPTSGILTYDVDCPPMPFCVQNHHLIPNNKLYCVEFKNDLTGVNTNDKINVIITIPNSINGTNYSYTISNFSKFVECLYGILMIKADNGIFCIDSRTNTNLTINIKDNTIFTTFTFIFTADIDYINIREICYSFSFEPFKLLLLNGSCYGSDNACYQIDVCLQFINCDLTIDDFTLVLDTTSGDTTISATISSIYNIISHDIKDSTNYSYTTTIVNTGLDTSINQYIYTITSVKTLDTSEQYTLSVTDEHCTATSNPTPVT